MSSEIEVKNYIHETGWYTIEIIHPFIQQMFDIYHIQDSL